METVMHPLLLGTALALGIIAFFVLRRSFDLPQLRPVRAKAPIRTLRRDPVTGEYRPH
jgi:hypothetical protein